MNTTELDSILAAATPLGLTSPRKIRTMLHLMRHHKCPMTDIATKLGTSSAAVTDIVDDLAKLGYVRREYGLSDRRQIFICITLVGRTQCERILDSEPVAA